MTILEVIKLDGFRMSENLIDQSSIKITKDGITVNAKVAINVNEEVEFVYYWYDHLTRGTVAVEEIERALNNKDWKLFSKYFYNQNIHKCTLPLHIIVFPKSEDYILGYLEMNEKNIELLTWSEYECG